MDQLIQAWDRVESQFVFLDQLFSQERGSASRNDTKEAKHTRPSHFLPTSQTPLIDFCIFQ